jgi:hypothetical protein
MTFEPGDKVRYLSTYGVTRGPTHTQLVAGIDVNTDDEGVYEYSHPRLDDWCVTSTTINGERYYVYVPYVEIEKIE